MFPDDEDFFAVNPVNPDSEQEDANSAIMTKWIRYRLEEMGFLSTFELLLYELNITGNGVLKTYWKEQIRDKDVPLRGEAGQIVFSRVQETVYDGPWVEHVPIQDFVLWPAVGDISKAMCVHRLYRNLDEVQNNPLYSNTELIEKGSNQDGKSNLDIHNELERQKNQLFGINDQDIKEDPVELLEAWGDFEIDGKMYYNYVATIANRRHLLRFQPNPFDHAMKPFVFCRLRKLPGQVYGVGQLEPVLGLHSMGQTIQNMILDEVKMKIHPQMKYEEDGIFDETSFEHKPSGLHKVGDINNLQPIVQDMNIGVGFQELNTLKAEFEEVTGVTKFSKGSESVTKARTAREAVILAQSEEDEFLQIAKNISREALTPIIKLIYILERQLGDIERIADYTNTHPQLMVINQIPMQRADVRITGINTSLLKQKALERMENFVRLTSNTPSALHYRWDEIGEEYAKNLGIEDHERFLYPEFIRQIINQVQLSNTIGLPPEHTALALAQAEAQAQADEFLPPVEGGA